MTVPAQRGPRRPSLSGRVLPLLLVVALLAPMAFLFVQQHRLTGEDRDLLARERLGVEYLRALGPLTLALVDAQSAAIAGRTESREALNRTVADVAAIDTRIGDELRTHERWTGLRAKLEALPEKGLTDPQATFAAYGEATDLLLALHRKVREGSGLIRDQQADSFYLQDAISDELPESMVATGRLADLATVASSLPVAERIALVPRLGALWTGAIGPANDLITNLRAAVDSTDSANLGASVLNHLDTYQRAIERLGALAAPASASSVTDASAAARALANLVAARTAAQNATRQLQPVILDELDTLLADRLDRLDRDRRLTGGAAGTAALLLAALGAVLVASARRARRAERDRRADGGDTGPPAGGSGWEPPADSRPAAPIGTLAPAEPRMLQPAGQGRVAGAERWGPFDAR
ncbi:hypothetical protein MCAG_02323 [Micromonospora sp. ATCC 39149]|uniref:Nitrate/nitrite sensing protein domain-containing protein n=1 Tax=Micromonospora carbonacea TaxID=47853 RepID=A0A7D6CBP3_9ACTN|nr:hypothetical protein [Micromonospora sp. ATCC 39149]EEP71996.1 hypothetical protein MCAG_02323 [Micromonospora sp. ATCC 39149]QLJ98205.1 hypothetical protein HZU44_26370 [Micromonospora carbonacea]